MPVLLEEPVLVKDEVNAVAETEKPKAEIEVPLYHGRLGVHSTPAKKRSPYWQPVDDQS